MINNNCQKTNLNNGLPFDEDTTRTLHIEQGQGEGNAAIIPFALPLNQPLVEREIENGAAMSINKDEQEIVITRSSEPAVIGQEITYTYTELQASVFYFITQIQRLGEFIQKNIDSKFIIEIKKDATIEQLIRKKNELNTYILKDNKLIKHYQVFKNTVVIPESRFLLKKALGEKKLLSVDFSLSVLEEIINKHIAFGNEKNDILKLSLVVDKKEKSIKGLDVIVSQAIIDLRKIMVEKYFFLLPIVLKLEDDFDGKIVELSKYGGLQSNSKCSEETLKKLQENAMSLIPSIASYSTILQVAIDLLVKIQKSPKTFKNLDLLLNKCTKYLDDFRENQFVCNWKNIRSSGFSKDYENIKVCLEKLKDKLYNLKMEQVWSSPAAIKVKKGQPAGGAPKKAKAPVKKKITQGKVDANPAEKNPIKTQVTSNKGPEEVAKKVEPAQINSMDNVSKEEKTEEKTNEIIVPANSQKAAKEEVLETAKVDPTQINAMDNISKEEKTNEIIVPTNSQEVAKEDALETEKVEPTQINRRDNEIHKNGVPEMKNEIFSIELKEDDFENVEETNQLLELVLQWIDKDRKTKSELQELKKKQAIEKSQEEKKKAKESIESTKIEKKPEVKVLGIDEKMLLSAILDQKTHHLIFNDTQIKTLIHALGGKVLNGSKNKQNIYFGNSNSKSGAFEAFHDKDPRGYLTGPWLEKVGDAIKKGVRTSDIAIETIKNNLTEEIYSEIDWSIKGEKEKAAQ